MRLKPCGGVSYLVRRLRWASVAATHLTAAVPVALKGASGRRFVVDNLHYFHFQRLNDQSWFRLSIYLALEDRCADGLGRDGCARSLLISVRPFRLLEAGGVESRRAGKTKRQERRQDAGEALASSTSLDGLGPGSSGVCVVRSVGYPGSDRRPSVIFVNATGL